MCVTCVCVARKIWAEAESHGNHQFSSQTPAATDIYMSVPSLWAIPLFRRNSSYDSIGLSIWRGELTVVDD